MPRARIGLPGRSKLMLSERVHASLKKKRGYRCPLSTRVPYIPYIMTAMVRVAFAFVALGACSAASAQFAAEQATAGQSLYQANCSSCHAADLGGRNEAPQLAGSNFMGVWGFRTAGELVTYIQTSMPPTTPGGLGAAAYGNLGAYILQSNGAAPGTQTLTAGSTVVIRSVATGRVSAGGASPAVSGPTGLTVSGVVKNYVPVTDEM